MLTHPMYQTTYAYSCHSEILHEAPDLESAYKVYRDILEQWELQPHDQYLELEYIDNEGMYHTVEEHIFNEGNWECEE